MKELAQHRQSLGFHIPRLTLAVAALLILGAAVAGALVLHGHQVAACHDHGTEKCIEGPSFYRPGWVDPAAFGIVVVGAAAAVGLLLIGRRDNSA